MGLLGATNLQEHYPLEMGLKIKSLESGEILNVDRYLLSSLTGHLQLERLEHVTSSPQWTWLFLLFWTLMTMNPRMTDIQTKRDNVKTKRSGTEKEIEGFSLDK